MFDDVVSGLYEYYEERTRYYFFDLFKMSEYELNVGHKSYPARATVCWHGLEEGASQINIWVGDEWLNTKPSKAEIDLVAFHEVCEALLAEMQELIKSRFITESMIPAAAHRVVRRLENQVFPLVKDVRNGNE